MVSNQNWLAGPDNKVPDNLLDSLSLCETASGFAQVYPEHKYMVVECLRRGGYKTGMTGDGKWMIWHNGGKDRREER